MSQYKTGTVTATPGSAIITGSGTLFLANVAAGQVFSAKGSGVPFIVGSVDSNVQITLASNYAGVAPYTGAGLQYAITTSYTPNQALPYPELGDIDTATIMKRAMLLIDTKLGNAFGGAGQANRVVFTDASGNLTTGANLKSDGSYLSVGANAAGGGVIRVPNNNAINSRNAANSGDINLIYADASNTINVGGGVPVAVGGLATFNAGLTIGGAAAIGASYGANGPISNESPIVRWYIGDGTGYSLKLAKRTGSVTTDYFSMLDTGVMAITKATIGDAITFTNGGGTHATGFLYTDTVSAAFSNAANAINGESVLLDSQSHLVRLFCSANEVVRVQNGNSRYVVINGSATKPTIGASTGDLGFTGNIFIPNGNAAYFGDSGAANGLQIGITGAGNDAFITQANNSYLVINTNGVETARFTAAHYFKASSNGAYNGATGSFHEMRNNQNGSALPVLRMENFAATAGNQNGLQIYLAGDPNNTTNFGFQLVGNATERATIRANGGFANFSANDVNLSDGSIKVGMVPAPDYCDFIEKASTMLKVGAYEDDPTRHMHTMFDSRDIEELDATLISPWQHSPLMVLKGLSEHEIQMRHLGATGALLRRLKVIEQHLAIS